MGQQSNCTKTKILAILCSLLEVLMGNPFHCLVQLLEVVSIPQLMTSSLHLYTQQRWVDLLTLHHCDLLFYPLFHF